ncbi:DUF3168 domain-containing protein [Arcobacter sp.]|uniref:DUF3168 domain-containing protein n=1 Tax=unclassified Arcobacter TaxID=2593671 RepID=UPI003B002B19
MNFINDLVTHLENDADISNLIGENIYPKVMPQGCSKPAIVYTIVNDEDIQSLQGEVSYEDVAIQLDCYSFKYGEAFELKVAVKKALYEFKHYPYDLVSRDMPYEDDTKLYRQMIEFKFNI